ncbi:trihelix transcription factor ASIL2-like [Solanum dulcamara]|uniref:trihelix transcription factor ASIL2-like n=1 Tax=Solanum dulcamara TaxID=45834 RepID=UPI0024866E5D|nr:trihelix transcription factor ASIL2-like [Solanum dulcamara]
MFRRHNHTDNPSPIASANPNSSTISHSSAADVDAFSPSGTMSDDDHIAPPFSNNNSPSQSQSPSPSRSPPPCTDNKLLALPPPPTLTPASVSARTPVFPAREDCWSEAATHTLIEAWGSRYVELNRGNLRHQHWEEVADAVNALHGHTKKQYRTDIQCKNRIDTLKKKYKIERTKVSQYPGRYISTWPFFSSLNVLIGVTVKVPPPAAAAATLPPQRRTTPTPVTSPLQWRPPPPETSPLQWRTPPPEMPPLQWRTPPVLPPTLLGIPVCPRSKRPAAAMDYTVSRRNFSAMAAAAAAASDDSDDEKEESETSSVAASAMAIAACRSKKKRSGGLVEGYKMLAESIGRFSEIYERVEKAKQRQMVELEKQRMQFAKDLEIQRMKLIMESQVHLEKLKRSKTQFRR